MSRTGSRALCLSAFVVAGCSNSYGNVINHLPTPIVCPANTGAAPGDGGPDGLACPTDAGCPNMGVCTYTGACFYDQCTQDQDCGTTGVCSCKDQTFGWAHQSFGNVCVPGNCRQDSDCGAGGRCSPTLGFGGGPFYGVEGYYCHTTKDLCHNDSDCSAGWCEFNPMVGAWSCNTDAPAG